MGDRVLHVLGRRRSSGSRGGAGDLIYQTRIIWQFSHLSAAPTSACTRTHSLHWPTRYNAAELAETVLH